MAMRPSVLPGMCAAVALLALGFARAPLEGQQTASLAGTVVDEVTGRRLAGVSISIVGAEARTATDDFGLFLLARVPVGAVSVRIAATGYVTVVEQIEVAETDFLQIRLSPVAAALDEVLVIAGRRDRGAVDATPLERPVESSRTALDVLAQDVPGVHVRRGGGNLGTGAAIWIRGAGTFGDNTPDVYLDGVRIDESTGGTRAMNVLDLIPAETVARIRVFKGPSGAAPFALGANGVILVETVRGAGPGR